MNIISYIETTAVEYQIGTNIFYELLIQIIHS